jgi:hypothetical protein
MRLIHRFQHFDPLTGELPDPYGIMFFKEVHRARNLLKGRTSEEIKQTALVINQIQRDPKFVDPMYQELEQAPVKVPTLGEDVEGFLLSDDVEALYNNIGNILLTEYQEFPYAQWYELFAVLSLSYVEKVCNELHAQAERTLDGPALQNPELFIKNVADECLGLARQARAYAESLFKQETTVKRIISDQKRKAINKRYADKTGPFKEEALRLYEKKYSQCSNREAASRVLKELTMTGAVRVEPHTVFFGSDAALHTDEPEKRIEKWIAEVKKKLL